MLNGCHLNMNAYICILSQQAHTEHTCRVQGNLRARKREAFVFYLLQCPGNIDMWIGNIYAEGILRRAVVLSMGWKNDLDCLTFSFDSLKSLKYRKM